MTCLSLGAPTPVEYRIPSVRAFNKAVLRAYRGMRQSQKRHTWVWLPFTIFPVVRLPDNGVVLEHAQDNARARLFCQDRVLLVKPLNIRLCGLCPEEHGGPYFSTALIYTFLIGESRC